MIAIAITIVGGIVATSVMSAALYFIHWRGFANADMIRALGTMVTKSEEDAILPGVLIHFTSGIIFAFIYVGFWSLWGFDAFNFYLVLGFITGLAHGLVVSFVLVALVAEHHPIEKFREAGMGVALAHLGGHVVYGLVLAVVVGAYAVRFDFIPVLAQVPQ